MNNDFSLWHWFATDWNWIFILIVLAILAPKGGK